MKRNLAGPVAYDRYAKDGLAPWDRVLLARLRAIVPSLPPPAIIVDVGAGTGVIATSLAEIIPDALVIALDADIHNARFIGQKRRIAGAEIQPLCGLAETLPFYDDSVHLLLCRATLHHIEKKSHALKEFYRVLTPGGRALIQDIRRDAGQQAYEPFATLRRDADYEATNLEEKLSVSEVLELVRTCAFQRNLRVRISSSGVTAFGFEIDIRKPPSRGKPDAGPAQRNI